jgi:hypothetical protein
MVAVAGGSVMIGLLRATPVRIDPITQPLSMYALTAAAWLFDCGVSAVALGVGILLLALVRSGRVTGLSVESIALLLCSAGLVTLLVFPDRNPHGTLSAVGWTHWVASVVAFGTLPIAPVLLGRRHRRTAGCSALPGIARLLALVAMALLAVFVIGSALQYTLSIPVSRIGGAVERCLAAAELATALLIGLWAWRGCPAGRHVPREEFAGHRADLAVRSEGGQDRTADEDRLLGRPDRQRRRGPAGGSDTRPGGVHVRGEQRQQQRDQAPARRGRGGRDQQPDGPQYLQSATDRDQRARMGQPGRHHGPQPGRLAAEPGGRGQQEHHRERPSQCHQPVVPRGQAGQTQRAERDSRADQRDDRRGEPCPHAAGTRTGRGDRGGGARDRNDRACDRAFGRCTGR